jgi:glycosyltransferase involved in cell wall biosynthesis
MPMDRNGPRHLAVIPAYNESDTVVGVIGSLREHEPGFDVLVVVDGSTDRTGPLAREAGATVLRLPFNLGIGGAVQAGFTYAIENGYDLDGAGRWRRSAYGAGDLQLDAGDGSGAGDRHGLWLALSDRQRLSGTGRRRGR